MDNSNIDQFIHLLKKEYKTWKAPVITMFSNIGASPFRILVSTLLSLRTRDEVTEKASIRLFSKADSPSRIIELGETKIIKEIYPVGFYPTKAKRLIKICHILIDTYDEKVPDTIEQLLELPGVGRKTANLVLTEGYNKLGICVDTHVHRISNRIGYVSTKTADKTEFALREKLPKKYWIMYNEILVAFGQVLCRPISPHCSTCPVFSLCDRIGVVKSR